MCGVYIFQQSGHIIFSKTSVNSIWKLSFSDQNKKIWKWEFKSNLIRKWKLWAFLIRKWNFGRFWFENQNLESQNRNITIFGYLFIFTCNDPWKLIDPIRKHQYNETVSQLLNCTEFFKSTDITELLMIFTDISNLVYRM